MEKILPEELDDQDLMRQCQQDNKKVIIVMARVHPGETNSSFVVQGFIKFITSQQPEAKELRSKFVFKVIPMINPDGVIIGNYRASIGGSDLNRQYQSPHP